VGLAMVMTMGCWFGVLLIQSILQYEKEKRKTTETENLPVVKSWLLQRIVICLLIGSLFFTAHTLWNIRQSNAGQTGFSSYKQSFLIKSGGETMSTWDDWEARIKYNVSGNITKWIPNVLLAIPYDNESEITSGQWLRGLLIILLFIAGLFYLKKNVFWLFLFYLGSSMTIVILFPEQYQGGRYLTPLIPFFIFLFFFDEAAWLNQRLPDGH
jgi:hypothetical protein